MDWCTKGDCKGSKAKKTVSNILEEIQILYKETH